MPTFDEHVCADSARSIHEPGMLGVKRKQEAVTDDAMDTGHGTQLTCKRHCKEVNPDPKSDSGVVVAHGDWHHHFMPCPQPEQEPLHHFTPSLTCPPPPPSCHHIASQVGEEGIHGCLKDVAVSNIHTPAPSYNLLSHPNHGHPLTQAAHQQSVMWMDMDGETYCPLVGHMDIQSGVMNMQSGVMNMQSGVMNMQPASMNMQLGVMNMQSGDRNPHSQGMWTGEVNNTQQPSWAAHEMAPSHWTS